MNIQKGAAVISIEFTKSDVSYHMNDSQTLHGDYNPLISTAQAHNFEWLYVVLPSVIMSSSILILVTRS